MYNIEGYFQGFLDRSLFQGEIVNEFDGLDELIQSYKHAIEQADNDSTYLGFGHELFYKSVNFPQGSGEYNLVWDITRAKVLLDYMFRQGNGEIYEVAAEDLYPYLKETDIDESRLPFAYNNEQPVIVVEFSPTGERLVIDGNHRVAARYNKDPKIKVRTIGLVSDIQINFMPNDLFRKLYVVHQNLFSIGYYMLGFISKEDLYKDPSWLVNSTTDLQWMNTPFQHLDGKQLIG